MLATVLEAKASRNIFCLQIMVGKEIKSTSTKETFLRVIVFNPIVVGLFDSPILVGGEKKPPPYLTLDW